MTNQSYYKMKIRQQLAAYRPDWREVKRLVDLLFREMEHNRELARKWRQKNGC